MNLLNDVRWGGGPPFSSSGDAVRDCAGTQVKLMGDSRKVLHHLSLQSHIKVAISSRTDEPEWAQECMQKLKIDPQGRVTMKQVFHHEEISKGNKVIQEVASSRPATFKIYIKRQEFLMRKWYFLIMRWATFVMSVD